MKEEQASFHLEVQLFMTLPWATFCLKALQWQSNNTTLLKGQKHKQFAPSHHTTLFPKVIFGGKRQMEDTQLHMKNYNWFVPLLYSVVVDNTEIWGAPKEP